MARLAWNQVGTPDFSPALQGYQMATSLLGSALGGLKNSVREFDQNQTNEVQRAIMLDAMRVQDPTKYTEALANGAFVEGVDPRRLTPEFINQLQAGVVPRSQNEESALRRDDLRGDIDFKSWTRGNTKDEYANEQAARPIVSGILAQANSNDRAGAQKSIVDNAGVLGKLGIDAQLGLVRGVQGISAGDQQYRAGELSYRQNDWQFGVDQTNYNELRQAQDIVGQLRASNIDAAGAEGALFNSQQFANVSPTVKAKVLGMMQGVFRVDDFLMQGAGEGGGIPSASAPAGGFAGGAADSSRVMNYEARGAGFSVMPDSVKTLGDASDFALTVNRAGVASSAMGTYQIVGQTLRGKNNQNGYAERVFGANWRSVPWNLEVEDKIAEAIFNDHKNSPEALRKQWVSLTPAEAARISRLPWSQARQVIAAGESGAQLSAPQIGREVQQGYQEVRTRGTADNPGADFYLATGYAQARQNAGASTEQVIQGLIGKGGALEGRRSNEIRQDVQRLVQEGVAPSVAGWAIAEAQKNRWSPLSLNINNRDGAQYTDLGRARQIIGDVTSGNMASSVTRASEGLLAEAQIPALQAQVSRAQANLDAAERAAQRTGGNVDLSRYRQALALAQRQLGEANAVAAGSSLTNMTRGEQNQPAQVRPPATGPRRSYVNGGPTVPSFGPTRSTGASSLDRILNFRMPGT